MTELVTCTTDELGRDDLAAIRQLLDVAFEGSFSEDDWSHTVGGRHVIARERGSVVSHGALVGRTLVVGGQPLATGYVEAVATRADVRRQGYASQVLRHLAEHIEAGYALGALSTSVPELYGTLGWIAWRGPTSVATRGGRLRTPDDDGGIMVLRTGRSPALDLDGPLTCDWRPGDVW